MKRFLPLLLPLILLVMSTAAQAQTVTITEKPDHLVHGILYVPVHATEPVSRVVLLVNGVKWSEAASRSVVIQVPVGEYVRRLRIRAVGYDAGGREVGQDEMVVNDPRPPFRAHLVVEPGANTVATVNVTHPVETTIAGVDLYLGEEKFGTATTAPFIFTLPAERYQAVPYVRVVARATGGEEANDVAFRGDRASASIDVELQQIPVSVSSGSGLLQASDLTLLDDGKPRKIDGLFPAADQPLYTILLIDYSESMLEELPVVKAAARGFAQALLRPQDRIAVVGFNQKAFWLTGFTGDFESAAQAVDRINPSGETHLYDTVIEMLYELQKQPGRHALVVLTDGVDQGSKFKLDHLVHYARYAGVPIYPIIKNRILSRWMRFGVGQLPARKLATIARDTGATYFIIQKEPELPAVYARIASELRQQYQLVFSPDAAGADQWRSLSLTSRLGQQLRIPRGYFP